MVKLIYSFVALFLLTSCSAYAEPFPEVIDDEVKITLQRTACFGSCPDYTVTIDGQGNVEFRTRGEIFPGEFEVHRSFSRNDGILLSGVHTDEIDPGVVASLLEQFRDAKFFSLNDEYRAQITDSPAYILTIDTGTASKTVVDYVGEEVGMPPVVTQLQEAVDQAAGSARWVDGAEGLVEWLEENNFNFNSDAARSLALEGALEDADDRTIMGIIDRGANLNAMTTHPWSGDEVVLGEELLMAAIERGRADLFTYLARNGWVERSDRRSLEAIFADNAAGCSASLARAFAAQGLSIDSIGEEGQPALAALSSVYLCNRDDEELVATAKALLDLGADPNKRDADGETAIFDVEYLPLLDLLYSHGAVADVIDKAGNSPALSSWTDEIVLRHLMAGARPVGRYYDGRTLWEQMEHRPMPKVEVWLDSNDSD
ncbi:DUF6438 domain-containing protein [Aurantiacibacter flavus]|uniref:DUF6438 domain-containing protein n=1 Tax=Aurantiacibacter flavus TaxID=3145232 RepID=A0ABV0CZN5_9SPHN